MELVRESMRLARSLGNFVSQVTLEQDLNIPDNKPDVEEIILHKGSVSIEAVRLLDEKAEISGSLKVEILYKCQGEGPAQEYLAAEMPIKDMVQTKGVGAADYIIPKWEVEDLKVKVLNSRKLTIS